MVKKVIATPLDQIFLSAVVIQEALAGRLSKINSALGDKSSKASEIVGKAYADLFETLEMIEQFQHLPYTQEDETAYRSFPAKIKRVGPLDCRIGIQAHRRGLIVVTQNVSDFSAAGIQFVDWSLETTGD